MFKKSASFIDNTLKSFKNHNSFGLADLIVDARTVIKIVFAVVTVFCVLCIPLVSVNYDLTKYLPEDAETKIAVDAMEREFGYPGTARIMVRDVSLYEAYMYRQLIANVEGVDNVLWINSLVFLGNQFINWDKMDDYYKDRCAVMDVTFVEGDNADTTSRAIEDIKALLGDRAAYAGPAVEAKSLADTVNKEVVIIMALAVVIIFFILLFTTTSWVEPFLFLSIMGIAIVINQGTNLMFGTISFLSRSVASVLQLATSMDYSIFLLHTYTAISKRMPDEKPEAMKLAIRKSAMPIMSSAMTTFVGFVALATLSFTLGRDIGFVLAKSILCSVFTVLLLMPALILFFEKHIERFRHRSFIPEFVRLPKIIFKLRYLVVAFMVLIVVPAYVAQSMNDYSFGNSSIGRSRGTQVYLDSNEIEAKFGRTNLYLVMVPNGFPVKERNLANELKDLDYVRSSLGISNVLPVGIPESFVPNSILKLLRSDNYARILVYTRTAVESPLAFDTCREIQSIVQSYYPEGAYVVGHTPSTLDIKTIILKDYILTEAFSVLGVAVVVFLSFQSLLVTILVLIPIGVATFLNMAVPYVAGASIMFTGYVVVSCVQLGATVDYSILLTNHYISSRKSGREPKEAVLESLGSSLLSILTSGIILTFGGYCICFVSSVEAISSIGQMIGRGACMSMILVLLGIPALMYTFDRLIFAERDFLDGMKTKLRHFLGRRSVGKKAAGKHVGKKVRADVTEAIQSVDDKADEREAIKSVEDNGDEKQ